MNSPKKNKDAVILAIDIGNSTIVMGCVNNKRIIFEEKVSTQADKTKIEHAMVIKSMLELNDVFVEDISGVIISSVVPPLTNLIKAAAKQVTGIEPLLVGPGLKSGLSIRMDDPRTVGSDLIVAAVAVANEYGFPALIVDVGTATTITAIDDNGAYVGGAIIPGLQISQDALVARTAQLPHVSLDRPRKAIGKNTVDSMKSGAIFGTAACIDGMLERFKEEMHLPENTITVATGGLGGVIIPECKSNIIYDDSLLLKGLKLIYDRNVNE